MSRQTKTIALILGIIALYYALQYASSAVHYNCYIIKDDCPPPIQLSAELIYREIVSPPWLDQFEIEPMIFPFKDGQFSFWEGEVDGKPIVIRIQKDESPVMEWIERGLPLKIPIRPANGEHIKEWFLEHPEYKLSK